MNEQVQKLMKVLDLTESEALQLIEDDKAVDRMKDKDVNNDLTPEQIATVKKARQADRKKPFIPDLKKRERKPNEAKRELMEILSATVESVADNGTVDVTNPERELTFVFSGTKYKIVLSAPRK